MQNMDLNMLTLSLDVNSATELLTYSCEVFSFALLDLRKSTHTHL